MTRMETLVLDGNAIKDVSPLAGMKDISYLSLEDNQISDVTPLSGLSSLLHLHLSANRISNVTPLARLTTLKKLLVTGNRITDLSPLAPLGERTWAGAQSIRVSAGIGSRHTLPTVRDVTGTRIAWQYPSTHPLAAAPVPASILVGQGEGLQRFEWDLGAPFSGEFIIDAVDATPQPAPTSTPARPVPPTPTTPGTTIDVYTTAGEHFVNGRRWRTRCEKYSSTTRCTTLIEATQVKQVGERFISSTAYVFNNMTYLPAPRALWKGNPLATAKDHTINGRKWRTECDTPATGRGGCRSYIEARVIEAVPGRGGAGHSYRWTTKFVFNNIVRFS